MRIRCLCLNLILGLSGRQGTPLGKLQGKVFIMDELLMHPSVQDC